MSELRQEVILEQGHRVYYAPDNNHVDLNFELGILSVPVKQALGLAGAAEIVIELIFNSRSFGAGEVHPAALNKT